MYRLIFKKLNFEKFRQIFQKLKIHSVYTIWSKNNNLIDKFVKNPQISKYVLANFSKNWKYWTMYNFYQWNLKKKLLRMVLENLKISKYELRNLKKLWRMLTFFKQFKISQNVLPIFQINENLEKRIGKFINKLKT